MRQHWAPRAESARRRSAGAGLVAVLGALALAVIAGGTPFALHGSAFLSPPPPPGGALRGSSGVAVVGPSPGAAASAEGPSVDAGLTGTGLALSSLAAALLAGGRAAARRRGPRATLCRAEGDGKTPLEELKVGDKVEATVRRVAAIGVWVDIGAVKDALLPKNMLPPGAQYKAGDKIPEVTISEVTTGDTAADRKIRVSLGEQPQSAAKEGDVISGTVARQSNFGVFFSVAGLGDVLAPTRFLDKPPAQYTPGDEVPLKVVSVDGPKVTVTTNLEGKVRASVQVGDAVEGTVSQTTEFGIFFNIGMARDALMRTTQLDKPIDEYKPGDKVPGLKVSSVNDKGQIEVSTRRLPSEVEVGEKLEGTVKSISNFGVFFDAGLATDVLAPGQLLSKSASEYVKEEVADLTVTKVDGSRITVTTKSESEIGTPLSKVVRGSEVTGKIVRVQPMIGLFIDIGAERDALLRTKSLPKPISEYEVGQELTGLLVLRVDMAQGNVELGVAGFTPPKDDRTSLMDLKVGQRVDGTVTRAMEFGVFVNIGAERDALWPANQLDKDAAEYKAGDKITGLTITQCDATNQRLSVSTKKSAADFEVGEELSGTVTKIMPFGVFVDIDASTEALLPLRLAAKEGSDYSVGEKLEGLKIDNIDVDSNKIAVSEEGGGQGGGSAGRVSINDLKVGEKVKAIVRKTNEQFGVFVDIGLGRKDALIPRAMLGDQEPSAFKANDEIEVWIARVDAQLDRVSCSIEEPPEGGFAGRQSVKYDGAIPYMQRIPDVKWFQEVCEFYLEVPNDEETGISLMIDEEPVPWKEWETKYPGMIKHAEKEVMLPLTPTGYGFSGLAAHEKSMVHWLPVPMHLRKMDAGEPTIPEYDFEDYQMGFDYGIKPEIHVKYREPPFNDPNWTDWTFRPTLKYQLAERELLAKKALEKEERLKGKRP